MKFNFLIPVLLSLPSEASTSIREYSIINYALNSFAYGSVDTEGLLQNYTVLVCEF